MRNRNWRALAFLVLGLVFAILGQYYLSYRRQFALDGLIFYAVALLMFGLLWREWANGAKASQPAERKPWWERASLRTVAAVGGILLSILAGWLALRRVPDRGFADLLWIWLIGVIWFLLAFVPSVPSGWLQRGAAWLIAHRREVIRLAALVAVALVVRGVALNEIPPNLGGDEGTWGVHGLAMLEGGRLANPFATRWFDFPSMSFLAWGLSMVAFGKTVAGLRTLSVLLGTATVLTTFLLARELWGRRIAWLAAAFLTFGHFHMHYSRLAVNNIADPLFITLTLWLLIRGLRSGERFLFVLAGGVIGLAWYGYVGSRLIPIILTVYLAWRTVTERGFLEEHWQRLVLLVLGAFVVAAPLLLYYVANPGTMVSRYNQVSIFASGWLAREQEITGRSALSLLLQQFWKSVSAFHYTLDPVFWYHASIPLLDFVSGVLILFGMGRAAIRRRSTANVLLLLWFWLAVILGWVLTENPPSSMRLVIVTPALAILVALGADQLLRLGRQFVGGRAALWRSVAAAMVGVVAVLNLSYYFLDYSRTRIYGNPTAEIADVLADDLTAREEVPPVFFDGAPHMYWDFGALAFRLRDVRGFDFDPDTTMREVDPERGALFVVLEENVGDLAWIESRFPEGETRQYYSDADGRLLFVIYEASPWGE